MKPLGWYVVIALVGAAPAAAAEICALDNVPAATLLLPYFAAESSQSGPKRLDALVTIRNADAAQALARVVIWTNMSVPVHAFTVSLTGYDVETFSMSNLLDSGPDGLFEALAGQASPLLDGLCASIVADDGAAHGYVTIDNIIADTDLLPTDPGYFGAGGVASQANVLTGDVLHVNPRRKNLEAAPLIAIEASDDDSRVTRPGRHTFYGRYVGWNASDRREPLPAAWNAPYLSLNRRTFSTLIVWQDSQEAAAPFACGTPGQNAWWPLGPEETIFFDEEENPEFVDDLPLQTESAVMELSRRRYRPPFDSGWLFLRFGANGTRQSWVEVSQQMINRRMRARRPATPMDSLCGKRAPQ